MDSETAAGIARRVWGWRVKIEDVFGECPRGEWGRLARLVERWSQRDFPILLDGERGSGKGHIARLMHALSGRRGAFVEVNCAGMSHSIARAELFGSAKGSFTGADRDRRGAFERAEGGTLFLDELHELAGETQTMLNHAAGQRVIEGVGMGQRPVDVWLIGGTNVDPRLGLNADFLDRFPGRLHVLPLRDRGRVEVSRLTDVLIGRIITQYGFPPIHVAPGAVRVLQDYHWPGNVRQLENVITAACVVLDGDTLTADDFAAAIEQADPTSSLPSRPAKAVTCVEVVREVARAQDEFAPREIVARGFEKSYVSTVLRRLVDEGVIKSNGAPSSKRRYRWAG